MTYRIKAYANLRHYFPDKEEDQGLETEASLTVREILERIGIPRPEIMLVKVDGRKAGDGELCQDGSLIELYPILAGG